MNNLLLSAVILIIMTCSFRVRAESKITNCTINFKTKGSPVLVSIEGKSHAPCTGVWIIENSSTKKSKVSMDLNKLDTGIPLRDKHLRENYLHTDRFPTATMTEIEAENLDSQLKDATKEKNAFKGMLELRGIKKPVQGSYEIKGGNLYSGEFEIDLPDFGIERPSFMGVKVVDKVYLTFKFKVE